MSKAVHDNRAFVITVDDEAAVREQVAAAFAAEGEAFLVEGLASGEALLPHLRGLATPSLPDVILLNRGLAGMSGDECIRLLKAEPRFRHISVVFLSARASAAQVEQGLGELGADAYIAKPFEPRELVARIKALLRLKRTEHSRHEAQRGESLRALLDGMESPLTALRATEAQVERALQGGGEVGGLSSELLQDAIGRLEQNQRKLGRYLEMKLSHEGPKGARVVPLCVLLRGLPGVGEEALAQAQGHEVWAEPESVRQEVLSEVLANAREHGGSEPRVTVTEAADRVGIVIDDEGPGLSPERVHAVFLPMAGGDAASLSLPVARLVMERLGGGIFATRREQGGTSFTVWFPRWRQEGAVEPRPDALQEPEAAEVPSVAYTQRVPLAGDADLHRAVRDVLMSSTPFTHVSPLLLDAVLASGAYCTVRAGTTLLREGSMDTHTIYFLMGGTVDIVFQGRHIRSQSEVGDAVGELAALSRIPRSADVIAATDCTLVELSCLHIEAMRDTAPERYIQFLQLMATYLGNKLVRATHRLRSYEDVVFESEQIRSYSAEMERDAQDKLRQIVLYTQVLQSNKDGLIIADATGRITSANLAACTQFGWPEPGPEDQTLVDVFPRLQEAIEALYARDTGAITVEWELEGPDGTMPVELSLSPVVLQEQVIAVSVFVRDISRHKELLRSLEASKDELANYSRRLEEVVAERTQALRTSNEELTHTNERLRKETEEKDAALKVLKETQAHILQSEKMASLGQLSAGVAHEINNPIGFVFSNLRTFQDYWARMQSLLNAYGALEQAAAEADGAIAAAHRQVAACKRQIDVDFLLADAPSLLEDSLEGASRVVGIVRNLTEFSHADQKQKEWSDINRGLESTLNLLRNELKYKQVAVDYGELPEIECYPQQLNQVFLNLLVNASQAIEEAGGITVYTRGDESGVTVHISDTGCGIPPENLDHIFEPFFTTKPVGKGTGLGLSLVYNIVQQHRGTITARSEVGVGTTFTLWLPVCFQEEGIRKVS